jgi:hypothetical protein
MAEAKIEIKVGAVSFSGEGDGKWLSEQLDKVIEKLPELAGVLPAEERSGGGGNSEESENSSARHSRKISGNLAAYLKEKGATANQVKKFLATAIWLHDHGKRDMLTTSDVVAALVTAKQSELTNASQSLNNNVTKGFCQKQGKKDFFVTDEGRANIG